MNILLNLCDMQPLFEPSVERVQKKVRGGRKIKKKVDCTHFLNKVLELTGREGKSSKVGTFEECESFLPFFQSGKSNECDLCTNSKEYACKRGRNTQDGVSCALLFVYKRKWGFFAEKTPDISPVWLASSKEGCSASFYGVALKQVPSITVLQKDKED